jgi:hypothetical protein
MLYPLSYEGRVPHVRSTTGDTVPGGGAVVPARFSPNSYPVLSRLRVSAATVVVMLIFHRRNRCSEHVAAPVEASEPAVDASLDRVAVLLSVGLTELAPALSRELGPGFSVVTEGPGESGVMIVGPCGPAGVAFLRASHRGVVILVVDRRWPASRPDEAVIHLEAGADGYLSSPPVAEVASHVRALVRRATGATVAMRPAVAMRPTDATGMRAPASAA